MNHTTQPLIRSTRLRLFMLLMRAFAIVVLLTTGLLLGLTGLFISRVADQSSMFVMPLPSLLESYYTGKGSWQNIESLFQDNSLESQSEALWQLRHTVLVDAENRIVLKYGEGLPATAEQTYIPKANEVRIPLISKGEKVGELVYDRTHYPVAWRVVVGILYPVAIISIFLGLLTLIIGLLLVRRVITPLAEVIAAARAVAEGDLSRRVQVQGPDDLRALSDSFNHMAEALQRNEQERRNLLADVAHELRTPLTVIRGRLEGILDGVYAADETHIAPALEETYILERLVDDLRLLTLAEAGQLHFDLKAVSLGDLAGCTIEMFAPQAAESQIVLDLQANPGLPLVQADPQRVEQVVGNLLNNALSFTPTGGKITIQVDAVAEGVQLSVRDSGPGVPEADLPLIFDRFWRAEKSRSRAYGGSGLGLAIARQMIEAQGGKMFAENAPEGGLRVGFVLPRAPKVK
jgi:two-component system OmpR family sensor kinase/two-component system sensor histidine kinase BaeS